MEVEDQNTKAALVITEGNDSQLTALNESIVEMVNQTADVKVSDTRVITEPSVRAINSEVIEVVATQLVAAIAGKDNSKAEGSNIEKNSRKVVRSERLRSSTHLHTMDKCTNMAKKRNLEELYSEEDKEAIEAGVNMMMQLALNLLNKKPRTEDKLLLQNKSDEEQE